MFVTRTSEVTRSSLLALLLLTACGGATPAPQHAEASGPRWHEWSDEAFDEARREGRPILLSVQAGWCHWCHVMNDVTYQDPAVLARLEGFVMVRADADARPDLAERYRRYGWPATVFLSPDGRQILGLRGYRAPARFRAILDEVNAAHTEGRVLDDASGANEPPADDLRALRASLTEQLDRMYDEEAGGWGQRQRYPFAAPVEHAFFRASVRGEDAWRERALTTLTQYARLIDPVWGGMYQYSERGVWDRPHFEKIALVQAGALSTFAEAYRVTGDEAWLAHADAVHRYLREHLRAPEGAFYTAQDADLGTHGDDPMPGAAYYALDDEGRRALGEPHIDTHVYASSNGQLIGALAELHLATRRLSPLRDAIRAAERVLRTHRRPDGLLAHDAEGDDPRAYLEDQAYFLAALVALHQATSDARWLEEATRLADAMEPLVAESGGYAASTAPAEATTFFAEPIVPIRHNAIAARALLALARLNEEPRYRERATAALRATARRGELRSMGRMIGEYLLALESLEVGHLVLSVVGPDDEPTRALHEAARRFYEPTALVELARPGASRYPFPGEPAVFLCSGEACSMPVTTPAQLEPAARAFLANR